MIILSLKIALIAILAATLFQYIGKYFLDYKIKNSRLYFYIFIFFPLFSISIDKETNFYELPPFKSLIPDFSRINLTNRFAGRVIIIERKNVFLKKMAITPDHPDSFLRELKKLQLGL